MNKEAFRKFLRHGDVVAICARAGCSTRVYQGMLHKADYRQMTSAEQRCFKVLVEVAGERQKEAAASDKVFNQINSLINGI